MNTVDKIGFLLIMVFVGLVAQMVYASSKSVTHRGGGHPRQIELDIRNV